MTGLAPLTSRFAVGDDGLAHSGVWRVWSQKSDLYCGVRCIAGELKASIHAPRPPELPEWKRHWVHPREASSEVAMMGKKDGGPHITSWPGCPLANGSTLEWRIIFRGSSLRTNPLPVDAKVALLPIPRLDEQIEVVVIIGAPGLVGKPRGYLLAEGTLANGFLVWLVFVTAAIGAPVQGRESIMLPAPVKSFTASKIDRTTTEFRGCLTGIQADGSLAFWDVRATLS